MLRRCAWVPVSALSLAWAMALVANVEPSAAAQRAKSEERVTEAHKQTERARRPVSAAAQAPAASAPAVPEKPDWPINNPPSPASVVLNSGELRIDAINSSLQEILRQVCTETGARIEGLNADQRVFGVYGPGRPRDVIAQLLEGTGYNVVMVGSHGNGEPLQIVLSERPTGGTQPNAPVGASEVEPPPYEPPVPVMRPPQPQQTPQQMMQEMQQREQLLREQQMRMQQVQPQNAPPR